MVQKVNDDVTIASLSLLIRIAIYPDITQMIRLVWKFQQILLSDLSTKRMFHLVYISQADETTPFIRLISAIHGISQFGEFQKFNFFAQKSITLRSIHIFRWNLPGLCQIHSSITGKNFILNCLPTEELFNFPYGGIFFCVTLYIINSLPSGRSLASLSSTSL